MNLNEKTLQEILKENFTEEEVEFIKKNNLKEKEVKPANIEENFFDILNAEFEKMFCEFCKMKCNNFYFITEKFEDFLDYTNVKLNNKIKNLFMTELTKSLNYQQTQKEGLCN